MKPIKSLIYQKYPIYPEFLEWKEGNRSRTKDVQQTYSRDLNFLIHVIGDKPINKVAKKTLKSVRACMPVMNKKSI